MTQKKNGITLIIAGAILLIALWKVVNITRVQLKIDSCLDLGGSWNSDAAVCEEE
jgi:hypothetical protein